MKKIIVVGGGAAGMMAAITAAENGCEVVLFEKNDRLGKKLFITGKGRCNLTNAGDADRFFQSVTTNSKFMYSPFYTFDNQMTIDFFEKLGLKTKVERGDRVFPVSDHSSDVIGVLKTKLNRNQGDYSRTTDGSSEAYYRRSGSKRRTDQDGTWKERCVWRCSRHNNWRDIVSAYRIDRRWLPVCKERRSCDQSAFTIPCSI